jgi:integrase
MKPYRRSKTNPNAPWYVQVTHPGGKREQYNTRKTDYGDAITEALRYSAEVRLGVHLRADSQACTICLQNVVDRYTEQAVHVSDATKKMNIRRLEKILAASDKDLSATPDVLTRGLVAKYQCSFLRSNPGSETSANSVVRQARSIFSRHCIPLYEDFNLPDISGFMRHPLLKEPQHQYKLPPGNAIVAICSDAHLLKITDPDAYIAFLLEMYFGLRANEVARATWAWVGEDEGGAYIDIPWEPHHKSGGKVSVHASVLAELRSLNPPDATGRNHILPGTPHGRYKTIYRRLSQWLHGRGLNRGKTNHELRKFLGSKIATEHGLFAAQKMLRHATPALTSKYYADWVGRPTPLALGA